jgi:hypothetical protein
MKCVGQIRRDDNDLEERGSKMKTMIWPLAALVGASILAVSAPSDAATATIRDARVTRTLVADQDRWGSCMALLDQSIGASGLDCPGQWVSFSCSGEFTAKDVGYKMFETAQMAQALGFRVNVVADDSLKHNGFCYANRIDVYR